MLPNHQKIQQGEQRSDQRHFPRWEISNCVLYRLENETRPRLGNTKDLNCAGARIASQEDISTNQRIQVTLYLTEKITVDLDAHIVWANKVNEETQFGISFIDAPGDAEELIFQHAFEMNKEKIVHDWFKDWQN